MIDVDQEGQDDEYESVQMAEYSRNHLVCRNQTNISQQFVRG